MTTLERQVAFATTEKRKTYPPGSIRFDLWMCLFSGWFLLGLYLDGWAHNHGRVDDTFFTPWHAVLYSGYLAVALRLMFSYARNTFKGYDWMHALPVGYMTALFGVVIFGFGGGFDMVWHQTFGFEENTEALLSPSHLLLALGAFLYVTAPLRAAWIRKSARGWRDLLPVVLTLTYLICLFTELAL